MNDSQPIKKPRLILCMPVTEQSELLKSIGLCQGFDVRHLERGWVPVLEGLAAGGAGERECLVLVELDELNRKQIDLRSIGKQLQLLGQKVKLVISANKLVCATNEQKCLALAWGAAGFIESLSKQRIRQQLKDVTGTELNRLFGTIKIERLQSFIATLPEGLGRSEKLQQQHRALALLEQAEVTLAHVEQWARSGAGFAVSDRTWHMRSYAQTFLGRQATSALSSRFQVSEDTAQIIGQLLQSSSVLDHVTFDHAFENSDLFYRFSDSQADAQLSLPNVFDVLRSDVRALDRRYMGKTYHQSFLGAEGADVVAKHFSVTHDTAVRWIQQLVELGLVRHVTNEHRFKPTENFYEFCGMASDQKQQAAQEYRVDIPSFAAVEF